MRFGLQGSELWIETDMVGSREGVKTFQEASCHPEPEQSEGEGSRFASESARSSEKRDSSLHCMELRMTTRGHVILGQEEALAMNDPGKCLSDKILL